MSNEKLTQLFDDAEEIGMIGSPSSTTELGLDILGESVHKNLVGELAMFRYKQDDAFNYALGQINEIELHNRWLEEAIMRSIVRERARLDGVSERQDTHQGKMIVSAVFADQNGNYSQSRLGTVPATGTHIRLVDDPFLDELLQPYKDEIFYLGTVYGSKPKLPLWLKHFDDGPHGAGEAYHLGVFGKTGSGKSVLAKMILLGYARHRQMGLFILDPMGEFSKGLENNSSQITTMGQILSPQSLQSIHRSYQVFDISNFYLETWELFGELLLESGFFRELGFIQRNNQQEAADAVIEFLRPSNSGYSLNALDDQAFMDSLNHLNDRLDLLYGSAAPRNRVQTRITEAHQADSGSRRRWNQTIELFSSQNRQYSIRHIVSTALKQQNSRPLVVVNLAKKPDGIPESTWNDEIKPLLIDLFLRTLTYQAQEAYNQDQSLNTLVVLDEAQRLAPRESAGSDRRNRIKSRLVDAAKTTRKCGLGWMFISQTLSSLDREIINSGLRVFFFGFGLGVGTEFDSLRQLVGGRGKTLELYQRFRDPGSSLNDESREYSFMTIGPISPLSFYGAPLFLSVFTKPDEFLRSNGIKIS